MSDFLRGKLIAAIAIAGICMVSLALTPQVEAARGDKAESEEFLQDARKFLKDGDTNAAVIQLKNALQKDRNNVGARKLLGEIYLRVGNGPAAEKELKAAKRRGADGIDLQILIARAYILQGKFSDVLDELRDEINDPAIRTDILQVRGRAYLGLGKRQEALEAFGEADKLQPGDIRPKVGLAKVYVSMGSLPEAEGMIDAALAIDQGSVEALVLKGELRRLKQDLEGAVAAFDRALKVNKTHIPALLGRAAALVDLNKDEQAQADIETVYSRVAKQPLASYLSALILAKKKDFAGAQEILQQASPALDNHMPSVFLNGAINYALDQLEQAADRLSRYVAAVPGNVRARKLLGATLVRKNDMTSAIDVLKPLVDSNKADAQVLALLASAYMRTGKFAEGSELFEKAVEAAPNVSSIRTQLALSRLVQGSADQAVGDLETAVDLDPEAKQASILLTLVHLRKGQFDQALASAQRLQSTMPENPMARNLIGAAYLGKKELAKARATFEAALKLKSDFHPARMNLAQLDLREGMIDSAIKNYETIISENPKHVGALLAMADVAVRQKRKADVVGWLKKASEADASSITPKLRLIQYYSGERDFQRAISVARELDTRVPNNPQVLEVLGRTEIAIGDPAAAVATFRRLANVASKSPRAYHLLGGALVAANDLLGARTSFQRAVEISPDFEPATMALVELEARQGNTQEALKLASQLQEKRPESSLGYMLIGDVHLRARAPDKAIAALTRLLPPMAKR
jgi:putative PEP-CTERM system TPR-repeat lipoprotein